MAMLAVLCLPLMMLGFTAIATILPDALASTANPGPHGFSEILYAYTSGGGREQRLGLCRAVRQHALVQRDARARDAGRALLRDRSGSRPPEARRRICRGSGRLPDVSGHDLLRRIRGVDDTLPVIVLSSRDDEKGKVEALDLGADDYVTKPFGINELLARMRAALRHRLQAGGERPVFQVDELSVDLVRRTVRMGERDVKLAPKRIRAAPPSRAARRQGRDPRPPAPGGLGRRVRPAISQGLRPRAPAKARARLGAPPLHHDGNRRRLPPARTRLTATIGQARSHDASNLLKRRHGGLRAAARRSCRASQAKTAGMNHAVPRKERHRRRQTEIQGRAALLPAEHLESGLPAGPARPDHAGAAIAGPRSASRRARRRGGSCRGSWPRVPNQLCVISTSSSAGNTSTRARRRLSIGHCGSPADRAVPAAEQDPGAIRRRAVIVVQPARLGAHHAPGHQLAHQVARERRGRDDAAAHGDQPAPQPGVEAIAVAVGADDHVARPDGAAGGPRRGSRRSAGGSPARPSRRGRGRRPPAPPGASRRGASRDGGPRCPCGRRRHGSNRSPARCAARPARPHRPRSRSCDAGARPAGPGRRSRPVRRRRGSAPVSAKSQSIPSSAMKRARSSRADFASASIASARVSPKWRTSSACLGRRLPLADPAVAVEAPSPGRCRSKTWTERPARASSNAALRPV